MIHSTFKVIQDWLPAHWHLCLALLAVAGIAAWSGVRPSGFYLPVSSTTMPTLIENEIDQALSTAAGNALGQREGTIIVVDPQTGRVRAVVNPQVAFEKSYAPGSTIKPFTALAALRAGLIDKNSRALCREHYARQDFATVCAHPQDLPPFNPAEAIAYSCNYFFGRLGERLNEGVLNDTLSSFGFGQRTSIDNRLVHEGQLLRGKIDPRNALGEGDHLQVTPIQLITAYSALVNGGHLFTSGTQTASEFQVHERAQVPIAAEHRAIVLAGMRGAVVYGTAARAGLNSAALDISGKTGTSTPLKGFRTQGWFVGFAADTSTEPGPAPEQVKLAVLVFLKRGHGAEAAQVSRTIFEEFARWEDQSSSASKPVREQSKSSVELISNSTDSKAVIHANADHRNVSVHLVSENITRELPLEDYVANVVSTEGSMEDQPEALKALAVAARTYALKNLGRHVKDGYDFCTTTHCQRYQAVSDPKLASVSRPQADSNGRALTAVRATSGEVLRDQKSDLVESYFSASCGGMTANMQTLWGGNPAAYLRGVRDESCSTRPHHSWTDIIPTEQLLQALHSDERTDPGFALHRLTIARRDATGRAELIAIDGERRHVVRGWDFKIIVGRKLGWNLLKSSRFEVTRSGANFVFKGSGFGHGLGLCQEGAHVMAQRGANYEQILGKYFPGTSVMPGGHGGVAALSLDMAECSAARAFADLLWNTRETQSNSSTASFSLAHSSKRISLSSEHFRVSYPVGLTEREARGVLRILETARTSLLQKVSAAGLPPNELPSLQLFVNATTGDFVGRTGQPSWAAAATRGNLIEIQPVEVLKRRGVLNTTLWHEMVHTLVDRIGRGRAPRWLAEGTALYFAGEGSLVTRYASPANITVEEIDERLTRASSAEEMRQAYAAAYGAVRALVKKNGEASLWRQIASS